MEFLITILLILIFILLVINGGNIERTLTCGCLVSLFLIPIIISVLFFS